MSVNRLSMKFCSCLLNRAIKETDNPQQVKRKSILIPLGVVVMFVGIAQMATQKDNALYIAGGGLISMFFAVSLFLIVGCKVDITDTFLEAIGATAMMVILISDLVSATFVGQDRFWPVLVVVIDVLLVCEAKPRTTATMVAVSSLYLLVMACESMFRFGILDIEVGNMVQSNRREKVECDKLPCPQPADVALMTFVIQIFVFVSDFYCTRGFAQGLLKERNQVLASIRTANKIANSLASYDLDRAKELLDESTIPSDLREAFESLLSNLKKYKPYLPRSCLPFDNSEDEADNFSDSSHSKTMSISQVSSEIGAQSIRSVLQRKCFRNLKASLFVVNVRNSITILESSLQSFESLVSSLVRTCFDIVSRTRGTPDLFLGDRLSANFGALRPSTIHVQSCLNAAVEVLKSSEKLLSPFQEESSRKLQINIGVATGAVACGDLGTETSLRYSVVGDMSKWVIAIERVGSSLGIPLAANEAFHKEVKETNQSKVIFKLIIYDQKPRFVFEIIPTFEVANDEWMYQIHHCGAGKWDAYNTVAIALLSGQPIPDELSEVPTLYTDLQNAILSGLPTPIHLSNV